MKSKFGRDVLWHLTSFTLMGITGITLNLGIMRYYGPQALGIFNQVFAIYIVLSQFAVLGVWLSVLKHTAEFADDFETQSTCIVAALFLAASLAFMTTIIGYLAAKPFGRFFDSKAVSQGWLVVLPGFWCFSLNKVLMAILNGNRDMRAFALTQISRYSMMILALAICIYIRVDETYLPLIMSWPEGILFTGLLLYSRRYFKLMPIRQWSIWLKTHLWFGLKSFLSGTMSELNTRVDVIMLGYFTTDANVGIYSMAAMIAEGISQLSLVLKNNLNPLLTRYGTSGELQELKKIIKKSVRGFYFVMAGILILATALFPVIINFLAGARNYQQSWGTFAILAAGIGLSAGYLPVNMLLVQLGYPGMHTLLKAAVVLTNLVLNVALIPIYGIYGAATATAMTYICSIFYLKYLMKKSVGIAI